MNHHERFRAIMDYEAYDRQPVWFFGTWSETAERWRAEGGTDIPGMDPDWEAGMWNGQGLVDLGPRGDVPHELLEEGDDYRVVRTSLGAVVKESTGGSSIPHTVRRFR